MLVVRQPRTAVELQAGVRFYANCYLRKYGTYPTERPENLFLAFDESDGNSIAGSIDLKVGSSNRQFEVEEYFYCDLTGLFHGARENMAEIGRLASANRKVTPYLFSTAVLVAERFGLEFFFSFNKRFVTRMLCDRLGFSVHVKPLAVREGVIPDKYASYFMDDADPVQMLYGSTDLLFERAHYWIDRNKDHVRVEMPASLKERQPVVCPKPVSMHVTSVA